MASKFGEFMASIFLPIFTQLGKEELKKVLAQLHKDDPEGHKVVLTSLYGPIDLYLEAIVKKSKTQFDDPFVSALKDAIEDSAAEFGIELPNVDEGTPGD